MPELNPVDEQTIELKQTSRYQDTPVYLSDDPVRFFGTWRPPKIFETQQPTVFRVSLDTIGRPDLVAHRVYGDADLFWPIAMRNGIMFPITELTAGKVLVCPAYTDVIAALTRED